MIDKLSAAGKDFMAELKLSAALNTINNATPTVELAKELRTLAEIISWNANKNKKSS